ncbi:MAG: sugar phosphate isomerase/epimerase, partial [Oscillospiraceae bacterium]
MKLGIYTNARRDMSFYDFLDYIEPMGIEMVEIGCGEESGFAHCSPETLMSDKAEFAKFTGALSSHHIGISALSCHGNPISPNKETADFSDKCMRNAVLLAEKLGLDTINCFSGCPGSGPEAKYINWITMSWPMDYAEAYEWQWNKVLVPYWKDFTSFAREHGVKHIALEMHPGQMCFNPKTVKRLRAEVGDEIGVNLDFSHLLWERMEPALVINELAGMIWHMHVKDVGFNDQLVKESGLVNFTYFDKPLERRWNFRSIGYGHGEGYWRQIFAELRR